MKRLRLWIKELSLSQQLLGIIFIIVTVFVVFFFVFMTDNINFFVENVMYEQLHQSNDSMAYYLNNNLDINEYGSTTNENYIGVIYDDTNGHIQTISTDEADENVIGDVVADRDIPLGQTIDGVVSIKGVDTLYSILRYDEDTYIISFLDNAYRNRFRSSLVNGVINLNILVVSVMFIVLMAWIGTIILPLNQIRNYIDKIKNDEPAKLQINRHDEIGEVADALVSMEEDLQKQNRIKEEMIQNISHDLKTPIATIKSYTESIKDGIYPYETLEKSCDVIIEHADRMDKKVRSLIMLNKMGYLNDTCDPGLNLNMKEVVEKAITSLLVVRPEISITPYLEDVEFHGEEEPWRIVVENLVDNALRYAKTKIDIILKPGELKVINDGSKIDESKIDLLFKPYETGSGGQFGLGLSIVEKVTSTYGYHVDAENLTDGVCFHIWNQDQMLTNNKTNKNKKEEIDVDDAETVELKKPKVKKQKKNKKK